MVDPKKEVHLGDIKHHFQKIAVTHQITIKHLESCESHCSHFRFIKTCGQLSVLLLPSHCIFNSDLHSVIYSYISLYDFFELFFFVLFNRKENRAHNITQNLTTSSAKIQLPKKDT